MFLPSITSPKGCTNSFATFPFVALLCVHSIIGDQESVIRVALACVYSCSAADATHRSLLNDIFESLPARTPDCSPVLAALQDRVDLFEQHLSAVEILAKYRVNKPLGWFLNMVPSANAPAPDAGLQALQDADTRLVQEAKEGRAGSLNSLVDRHRRAPAEGEGAATLLDGARLRKQADKKAREEVQEILISLSRRALRRKPALSSRDWRGMRGDLQELRSAMFSFVEAEDICVSFLECVLAAGQFEIAVSELQQIVVADEEESQGDDSVLRLPIGKAEAVVLSAAKEMLNSAPSALHATAQLARHCLHVLPAISERQAPVVLSAERAQLRREWQEELDLVDGVTQLAHFGVDTVPLEVRLKPKEQRLSFVQLALDSIDDAYMHSDELLTIARLLGCSTPELQAQAKLRIIAAASVRGQHAQAYETCLSLMQQGQEKDDSTGVAWRACRNVAEAMPARTHATERAHLLAHCLYACDVQQLDELLPKWQNISVLDCGEESVPLDGDDGSSGGCPDNMDGEQAAGSSGSTEGDIINRCFSASLGVNADLGHATSAVLLPLKHRGPSLLALRCRLLREADDKAPAEEPELKRDEASTVDFMLHEARRAMTSGSFDEQMCLTYLLSLPLDKAHSLLSGVLGPGPVDSSASNTLAQHIAPMSPEEHRPRPWEHFEQGLVADLAFRYFCLVALRRASSIQIQQGQTPDPRLMQRTDASLDALQAGIDYVARDVLVEKHGNPALARVQEPILMAAYYAEIRSRSQRAEFLLSLCPDLDVVQFTRDPKYKYESVMSLARGVDGGMDTALALCERYSLPVWDLYLSRVQWALAHVAGLTKLKEEVQKYSAHLLQQPARLLQALLDESYAEADGEDLEILHYIMGLCNECALASEKQANKGGSRPRSRSAVSGSMYSTHTQVLERLLKLGISVNYKHLLSGIPELQLAQLHRAVSEHNVLVMARLASRLDVLSPDSRSESVLSSSRVFLCLLSKSLSQCLAQHESVEAWMKRHGHMLSKITAAHMAELLIEHCAAIALDDVLADVRGRLALLDFGLKALTARATGPPTPTSRGANENQGNARDMADSVLEVRTFVAVIHAALLEDETEGRAVLVALGWSRARAGDVHRGLLLMIAKGQHAPVALAMRLLHEQHELSQQKLLVRQPASFNLSVPGLVRECVQRLLSGPALVTGESVLDAHFTGSCIASSLCAVLVSFSASASAELNTELFNDVLGFISDDNASKCTPNARLAVLAVLDAIEQPAVSPTVHEQLAACIRESGSIRAHLTELWTTNAILCDPCALCNQGGSAAADEEFPWVSSVEAWGPDAMMSLFMNALAAPEKSGWCHHTLAKLLCLWTGPSMGEQADRLLYLRQCWLGFANALLSQKRVGVLLQLYTTEMASRLGYELNVSLQTLLEEDPADLEAQLGLHLVGLRSPDPVARRAAAERMLQEMPPSNWDDQLCRTVLGASLLPVFAHAPTAFDRLVREVISRRDRAAQHKEERQRQDLQDPQHRQNQQCKDLANCSTLSGWADVRPHGCRAALLCSDTANDEGQPAFEGCLAHTVCLLVTEQLFEQAAEVLFCAVRTHRTLRTPALGLSLLQGYLKSRPSDGAGPEHDFVRKATAGMRKLKLLH